ncbi:hypothetical protein FNV43_RR25436 [Rhamnella rubrinervis]|uniref:Uncharacterized protein n=1 Tax=Rhamnella rubrinervis TaxID=2594499 RepID=A0A8K0DSF4_9ROSA|nr:hypothetical protein FNV43_RR25436 [Rhamnella rubrinervis]
MAVSAFKSSSRRTNFASTSSSSTGQASVRQSTDNSPKKAPLRRSRSVSAFSRTQLDVSSSTSDDFLNKRDNPLFWTTGSPPDLDAVNPQKPLAVTPSSTSGARNLKAPSSGDVGDRRGRSATRNSDGLGNRKELVGRSLSRVDTGRRNRSVSSCPVSRRRDVSSESEAERECGSLTNFRSSGNSNLDVSSDVKKEGFVSSSSSDMADQLKGLRTWSSQHSTLETSHDSTSLLSSSRPTTWEDGVSTTSSLSGAEEKTINAVCEEMKSVRGDSLESDAAASGIYETVRSEVRRAISEIQIDLESAMRRNNTPALATTNVADIPPDLVSPSAIELVLDIRREYAKKLEQSQERARKLRADLAVEEQRGQELSRILKEVLPDPKTPNVQKSRPGRKTSIERRKMSKRLTEEAMAYFDECVSLSTFDSSDFSSAEDPPLNLVGETTPVCNRSLLQATSSASAIDSFNSHYMDRQESGIQDAFRSSASGHKDYTVDHPSPTSVNTARDLKSQFSFARKPLETLDLQQDIQKYIRNSDRSIEKGDINSQVLRQNRYDSGDYNFQAAAQSLVFERFFMRNRIGSGSLLLCSGGNSVPLSPFASFI